MFVDTFIRRPILATVCSLIIVLAGALAIPTMPIAWYPSVTPPTVSVAAVYTGANAEVVETAVTTPLEQAINGVEGMQYMTSSSTNSGFSQITVTFDVTRDPDLAAVDVQNRVNQALGRLPGEVRQLGVIVQKGGINFVSAGAMFSANNEYDSLFMSNYVDVYIKDTLKRVPGVADIIIFGERKYSMRVWLDPIRLAARQITAGDVVNALREQNVNVAAGSVGDAPAREGQTYQISVRAAGRLSEASEFENVIVKAGNDGSLVRLRDVGTVELGAETYANVLRFQGKEAIGFAVTSLPTANALDVQRGVTDEMRRLQAAFPPGLQYNIAFDTTTIVQESITEVVKTLAEAVGLVVLVMFLFLQSWRATIIPALTMPVSLIGTFAFVNLLGFSINTLTLFAIVLATGIVVDDAIVVIENIERHLQEYKKPPLQAASDAMREVFGAVIATALVLIAVFVPVAFFPGTTGRLYQQFALTIAFAVAISAFNALTLTPALSALLLREGALGSGWFFGPIERAIHGGTSLYVRMVSGLMRARWAVVVVFVVLLGATYYVYTKVPSAFVPDEDAGYFITIIQAPPGASLDYTSKVAAEAEKILMATPEVESVFTIVGFSFSGSASNQGLMFVLLKPFEERNTPEKRVAGLLPGLRGQLFGIQGAFVIPFAPPGINIGNIGGFAFQVLDQSGNPDIQNLGSATQALVGASRESTQVAGLFSSFTVNDPQLAVDIDREKAQSLGLPLSEITNAMQIYLGSAYVNDFDFNNRAYRVYVQADKKYRSDPADLGQYYVRTKTGQMVPLANVVSIRETTAPQVISHFNLFRSAEVSGSAAPGVSSGQALAEMERLAGTALPPGFGFAWSGISLEEVRAGGQSAAIFGIALLLVYLTLAAQYESLVLPFIVLLGVPLAVLGALSAQWARGLQNDLYCQIGLVLLVGLAAKNSILIVEFAEQLRGRGMSVIEAAIEASRIRLRPILMTSLAFILGVMPLVFASGAGQEGRHSVGTSVVGGMLFATFLNILFIPVLYVVVQTLRGGTLKRAAAVVLAAVLLPGAASAQVVERVTFEDAVRRAVANNPTVQQAAAGIVRAEALLQQVRSSSRPSVDASFSTHVVGPVTQFSGASITPRTQTVTTAGLTVPLLTPVSWAQRNQAADQILVSQRAADEARRQVGVAAAQAYLAVIAQRRVVDLNERARDNAKAHYDYANQRYEGGIGSRLNALRAQQELSSNEARVEEARLAVRRAQEALGVLVAADGPVDATTEPDFATPDASTPVASTRVASTPVASTPVAGGLQASGGSPASEFLGRADILQLIAREMAAERVASDSWKERLPSVSALFTPQFLAPSGLFNESRSWRASVVFSVPLFDSGLRKGRERERIALVDLVRAERASTERQAASEVRTAREAIRATERALARAKEAAAQANEVMRITDVAFREGATTNIEVIDAQRRARDAETAAVIAEDALRRARLDLLVSTGRFPQ